jgi:RNA polymerase sigma factor (sigma-70 family)
MKPKDGNDDSDVVAVQRKERFQKNLPQYLKMLLALGLRLTRNHERSREIVQQTVFKYFSRMEEENWQQDIKNEGAYLARIARNLVNDGWGACGNTDVSLDDDDGSVVPVQLQCTVDLEKSIYLEELHQTIPLKTILGGFTEHEMLLLKLREVEGLSNKEIAQQVNKHPAVVRYEIQRIKATIRARVKGIFGKKSFFRSES